MGRPSNVRPKFYALQEALLVQAAEHLIGHVLGRITTHYSAAELSRLLEAANAVLRNRRKEAGIGGLERTYPQPVPTKPPQSEIVGPMKPAKPLTLLVPRGGIEPPTRGFSVRCSTD